MKTITIQAGNVTMQAELNESPTAKKVWEALPIQGKANRWGDEIYFPVPHVVAELDDTARTVVEVGDLGYWPNGRAF